MHISIPKRSQRQADARSIIANPQPEHTATLRLLAWAALKAERGQIVRQHRLHCQAIISDQQVV
jgi:hypothetical protein